MLYSGQAAPLKSLDDHVNDASCQNCADQTISEKGQCCNITGHQPFSCHRIQPACQPYTKIGYDEKQRWSANYKACDTCQCRGIQLAQMRQRDNQANRYINPYHRAMKAQNYVGEDQRAERQGKRDKIITTELRGKDRHSQNRREIRWVRDNPGQNQKGHKWNKAIYQMLAVGHHHPPF